MTGPEADYGERLRRALHAAADGVVPSGDGLERIHDKIAHARARHSFGGRLLLDVLRRVAAGFRASVPDLRAVFAALKSVLLPASHLVHAGSQRLDRSGVGRRRAAAPVGKRHGWWRPVLAAAGAVLVAAAILAIPGARHRISVRVSSLVQHPGAGRPARDKPGPPKPRPGHPGVALGPGTRRPSSSNPATSPSPRQPSASTSHRPKHLTTPPASAQPANPAIARPTTTCVPVPGKASTAATPTAAARGTGVCPTPTGALTWSPTPTATSSPTPSFPPTPSGTSATQDSAPTGD